MIRRYPNWSTVLLLLQYSLRILFAYTAMHFLLARAGTSLVAALPQWSFAAQLVTVCIQLAMLSIVYELREYFVKDAGRVLQQLPAKRARLMIITVNLLLLAGVVPNLIALFSFTTVQSPILFIEMLLLSAFVWLTAGIAVPLAAGRYIKWLRRSYSDIRWQ